MAFFFNETRVKRTEKDQKTPTPRFKFSSFHTLKK